MTFRLLIGSLISFSFFSFATAKTPLEVLEPYRSYKAALKKQQFADAQEFAYEAWQKAEKLLKDSRTTGDLAYNYAILPPDSQNADIEDAKTQAEYTRKRVRKKVYNRIRDAFDRSIELAELHAEIPYEVEVQRRIRSFEFDLTGVKFSGNKLVTSADQSELYLLDKAIVDFGLIGTTYEAEALTLRSQYYRQRANNDKALEYSEKAIELFEKNG